MVHYEFFYGVGGDLSSVKVPNGSTFHYDIDGYGRLFRIRHAHGTGDPIELGRRYIDTDLRVSELWQLLEGGSSPEFAKTVLHRNHSGKGYVTKVVGPTGIEAIATLDAMARTTRVDVKGNTGTVRYRTDYEYDGLSRRTKRIRHLLNGSGTSIEQFESQFDHAVQGSLLSVTDEMGRKSIRKYDTVGRLKQAFDVWCSVWFWPRMKAFTR